MTPMDIVLAVLTAIAVVGGVGVSTWANRRYPPRSRQQQPKE